MSLILFFLLLVGCAQGSQETQTIPSSDTSQTNGNEKALSSAPVKLSFYMGLTLSDEWIKKYIIDPVKKKYPNISIDIIRKGKDTQPADLVAADNFPDFWYDSTPRLFDYQDLGLLYDMNDLIKKHNFDLSKLNQPVLDGIKMWGDKGELYGLPLWMNYSVLYYNKDIFDKFGVEYPKDGMTWEEAIDFSRKLTRTDQGINYIGLDVPPVPLASELSLPYVDTKTNTSVMNTEGFKRIFQIESDIYQIPGGNKRGTGSPLNWFLKDRNLAMMAYWADTPALIADMVDKGEKFNWDMATVPTFKERPGFGFQVDSHNLHISSSSKNKEAAFQVITYLLSKEPQMELERNGYLSVLTDPEMNKNFGKDLGVLDGKHIEAIFKTKPTPLNKMSKYDSLVQKAFNKELGNAKNGVKDINTALKDANEAANILIQESK